ncbi:hypothetical protein GCM10009840_04650 [Pseudolysinimonas kribbensis]|uniref:Phage holin family protein n=1 Tax=Pseudolysinimonas kribbensis TaxID=433641 RepID=A0ABQ6K2F0_9MICO|nr:hypothetical protein [Pseudolysinimonas kribbensis]GMA94800.1 hypothetical protein GCM10025881_16240 [Pseudolysinimonas kribbensis]
MSYSQQPGRSPAPMPNQLRSMSSGPPIAPQQGGYRPQTGGVAPQRGGIAPLRGGIPPIPPEYTVAPTLGQFWRSDVRRTRMDGTRRVRWPGFIAFFVGLAAAILLLLSAIAASVVLASIALAFSIVAGFFAIVTLVAGFGRVLGLFGLLLALAGNIYIVAPLFGLV